MTLGNPFHINRNSEKKMELAVGNKRKIRNQ